MTSIPSGTEMMRQQVQLSSGISKSNVQLQKLSVIGVTVVKKSPDLTCVVCEVELTSHNFQDALFISIFEYPDTLIDDSSIASPWSWSKLIDGACAPFVDGMNNCAKRMSTSKYRILTIQTLFHHHSNGSQSSPWPGNETGFLGFVSHLYSQ